MRTISHFWILYAAGRYPLSPTFAERDIDAELGDAAALEMRAWLELTDAQHAAIVARYAGPDCAFDGAAAPAPRRRQDYRVEPQVKAQALSLARLLPIADVAAATGVHTRTVYRWLREQAA